MLKLTNVKDYDRYITMLSQEHGLISVYAKGIRRAKNTLSSRIQLFSFVEVIVFKNKGIYYLNEAEIVYSFRAIREDMLALTAASQLAELILDQTHEAQEASDFYELFIRACYTLENKEKNNFLVTWLAQQKILFMIGYQARFEECLRCAKPIDVTKSIFFDHASGTVLCDLHGLKEQENIRSEVVQISHALYQLLQYIDTVSIAKLFSIEMKQSLIDELGQFTKHYVQVHLDKDYDKFHFFKDFHLDLGGL